MDNRSLSTTDSTNSDSKPRSLLSAMSDLLEWALSLVKSEELPSESTETEEEIKETSGS